MSTDRHDPLISSCSHEHLWGKKTDDGTYYPLLAHLVDTAAAMKALLDVWLPDTLAKRLIALVGVDDREGLTQILCSLAAYHDIGKINPTFQGQQCSVNHASFATKKQELEGCGFDFKSVTDVNKQPDPGKSYIKRHEVASGLVVEKSSEYNKVATHAGLVLAGHHGRWATPSGDTDMISTNACTYYKTIYKDSSKWHQAIVSLELDLCKLNSLHSLDCLSGVKLENPACIPLLTALVCLADWIASDKESVNSGLKIVEMLTNDISGFYKERLAYFTKEVPNMLGTPKQPKCNFEAIFGFAKNPLQAYMCDGNTANKSIRRGLTIVMTPMGSGKTEAALGHWLTLPKDSKQGLYFGLPTMATADVMFDRVRGVFREDTTYGALLHGRSVLNSFYDEPTRDVSVLSYDESQSDGLVAGDWFNGKHRALFSPIGVGTVDQVLQTVLRHKYNYMRLLALATKTVVLDEVHSFDPYMHGLLEKLLEWAGMLQLDIVLLSATLPKTRLASYVQAYRKGMGLIDTKPTDGLKYPSVLTVAADSGKVAFENLKLPLTVRCVTLKYAEIPKKTATEDRIFQELETIVTNSPDAKVGAIVNTVKCAQAIAKLAQKNGSMKFTLFHSRTTAALRSRVTKKVIEVFGKNSTHAEGHVLIATQVAEQSLDVDFDYIISEMCPMASLVQRMGRLHRFTKSDDKRPAALSNPTMLVVHKATGDLNHLSALPYPLTEIRKTQEVLLGESSVFAIHVPGDIQILVDKGVVDFKDISGDVKQQEQAAKAQGLHLTQKAAALENSIQSPAKVNKCLPRTLETTLRTFLTKYSGDKTNSFTETRWSSQESATIILYTVNKECTSKSVYKEDLPDKPTKKQTRELLGYTITLSGGLASKLCKKAKEENGGVFIKWDTGILKGILCVNMDSCRGWLEPDDVLGLYEV